MARDLADIHPLGGRLERPTEPARKLKADRPRIRVHESRRICHYLVGTAQARLGRLRSTYLLPLRRATIGSEPKVACFPTSHPLARRRVLSSADLDGEPILDAQARRTSSVEEKFELVAAGHGIAIVPQSVARSHSRPDLAYRTVPDVAPVATCLVMAEGRRESRVLDFVKTATEILRHDSAQLLAVD